MYGQLALAFGESVNPKATAALGEVGEAAERIREADADARGAIDVIGEYIEVVKGDISGAGSTPTNSASSAGSRFDPAAHLRDMPTFPGTDNKTHGRALSNGGKVEPIISGELDPKTREYDPRYVEGVKLARRLGKIPPKGKLTAAGDVELKWALQMRKDGVKRSLVTINNPKGPCQGELSCDALLPIWLDQDSELTVCWCDDQGRDQSKTYVGEPDEH
ncbi:DddA-like double-stranded DNA deaminase toxin [Actinorhabdospora filicis]|nr:DddA-like double-stranded DNA deaminase toxin [Actinorhabdospora filicis]